MIATALTVILLFIAIGALGYGILTVNMPEVAGAAGLAIREAERLDGELTSRPTIPSGSTPSVTGTETADPQSHAVTSTLPPAGGAA